MIVPFKNSLINFSGCTVPAILLPPKENGAAFINAADIDFYTINYLSRLLL